MRTWLTKARSQVSRLTIFGAGAAVALLAASSARADEAGGEANLKLPDLSQVSFHGMDGHKLLLFGILFCLLGLAFGLVIYTRLKNLPVHKSMRGISELIYETCKTYLTTQDRKSTRLNSSHGYISYAVFCLKKKKKTPEHTHTLSPSIAHDAAT